MTLWDLVKDKPYHYVIGFVVFFAIAVGAVLILILDKKKKAQNKIDGINDHVYLSDKYGLYGLYGLALLFTYLVVNTFYNYFAGSKLPVDVAGWGQAGDFFGGILNPFFAFFSFMALLYTIRIQTEELRLTREELRKTTKAAETSALLERENLEQQKDNIKKQLEIARYQQLMEMSRMKIAKVQEVFAYNKYSDSFMYNYQDKSIEGVFSSEMGKTQNNERVLFTVLKSRLLRVINDDAHPFNYAFKALKQEIVNVGLLIREIDDIANPNDVYILQMEMHKIIGILFCYGIFSYQDPQLLGLRVVGKGQCPFDMFLDAYMIKRDF